MTAPLVPQVDQETKQMLREIKSQLDEMAGDLHKLRGVVYGNGQVGLAEKVRNLEAAQATTNRVFGFIAGGIGAALVAAILSLVIK